MSVRRWYIMTSKIRILTCHQIGLNGQSHYAHKDVIAEVSIISPHSSQLWDYNRIMSFEWSHIQQSKWAYVIKHCVSDKQVRECAPDEPDLMKHCHSVRKIIQHIRWLYHSENHQAHAFRKWVAEVWLLRWDMFCVTWNGGDLQWYRLRTRLMHR